MNSCRHGRSHDVTDRQAGNRAEATCVRRGGKKMEMGYLIDLLSQVAVLSPLRLSLVLVIEDKTQCHGISTHATAIALPDVDRISQYT